jgi:hypothetical protein
MAIPVSMKRKNDCFGSIARNTTMKWMLCDNFEVEMHRIRLMTMMMMTPVMMPMVNDERPNEVVWGDNKRFSLEDVVSRPS